MVIASEKTLVRTRRIFLPFSFQKQSPSVGPAMGGYLGRGDMNMVQIFRIFHIKRSLLAFDLSAAVEAVKKSMTSMS
jgi:hypothetical protein